MALGDLIHKFREEHGMSMDKFAEASGLSKAYISILEKNKTPRGIAPVPSIGTFRAVASAGTASTGTCSPSSRRWWKGRKGRC